MSATTMTYCRNPHSCSGSHFAKSAFCACAGRSQRRGFAIIIVLAILSITLAMSYAMMRTNSTNTQIQSNFVRRADARQAAYAGLSCALRNMQQSSWGGINSKLEQNLGGGLAYVATFATGDASLSLTDSRFAYRVTVTSKGTVTDPAFPTVASTFTVSAVVQLIPRKLPDEPVSWSTLQPYTLYQWGTTWWEPLYIDVPARIEGPIFAETGVYLAYSYPGDGEGSPFAGQVDEMAIFGKALTAQQVADLSSGATSVANLTSNSLLSPISHWRFNESAGSLIAYDELRRFNGLYDGGKSGASAGPRNGGAGSLSLDGYNDHVHLGNVVASGNALTILAWVKPTELDSVNGRIIAKSNGIDDDSYYWMLSTYKTSSNYRLRFRLKTNSSTDTLIASSGNLAVNQWTFVAAVYDGSKMRLYKDGVLVGSMDKSGDIPAGSSVPVSVGNDPPASPRAKLFRDWSAMKTLTGVDYRPLTGPIHAPQALTAASTRSLFTDELQLTWNNVSAVSAFPLTHPGEVSTYQLYPGGKVYNVARLGLTLNDIELAPDPVNNPLNVCYCNGSLAMQGNVTFTGVLIVNGSAPDLDISGQNNTLNAVSIPSLDGSSSVNQLPVAMVLDDCNIHGGSTGSINGLIASWDKLGFLSGTQSAAFSINGKVIAKEFYTLPRTEWEKSNGWWSDRTTEFLAQLARSNPNPFFSSWLQTNYALNSEPRVRIRPDATNPTYHWPNWTQPIFVVLPSDGGLRWEVVSVQEVR